MSFDGLEWWQNLHSQANFLIHMPLSNMILQGGLFSAIAHNTLAYSSEVWQKNTNQI